MSEVGHNRRKVGGVAVDQLKSIIGRVEKLEEEKAGIAADIRDVFAEAKGNGFDVKAIRTIIKMRKKDAAERVFAQTLERAKEIGLQAELLPTWYDLDDAATLERLRRELAAPAGAGYNARHTRGYLESLQPTCTTSSSR